MNWCMVSIEDNIGCQLISFVIDFLYIIRLRFRNTRPLRQRLLPMLMPLWYWTTLELK